VSIIEVVDGGYVDAAEVEWVEDDDVGVGLLVDVDSEVCCCEVWYCEVWYCDVCGCDVESVGSADWLVVEVRGDEEGVT
jgi:hypothetical protein